MNRRHCIASLAGVTLAPACFAARAAIPNERRWPALQATLDEFVAERHAAGVSVAITFGDSAPAYPSAGTLAFDTAAAFDRDSICRIYSMTKNITRIATLLLVEDGKLALDQPVADVLHEFRNLRVAIDFEKGLASRPATLDELVARVAELPLAYEPGTVLHYSIGFDVMALVIQRLSGMTYDAFLQKRVFAPLQMTSTGFQVSPGDARRLTTNYDATERGANSLPDSAPDPRLPPGFGISDDRATSDWLKPPALLAGGAGVVSTSRDFLRYAQMLLDDGAFAGARVMRAETARLATGDINPPGVAEPGDGAGSGTRALLRTPIIPAGTVGGGGSAGTLFWIDKARRGAVVFMAQVMYGSPARSPFQKRLFAAIEKDLSAE
jgi:CubicO group peptidase (beta-lactamase class C family)